MMNKLKFFIAGIVIVFISFTFSSCLKDTEYMDVSNTEPIIQFGLSAASSNPYPIAYSPVTTSAVNDTAIAVVLASPQVLSDTVQVTFAVDTTQITPFNTANGAAFTALPDSLYVLPQTTVNILPGHRVGSIPVVLNFPAFPASYNYALPISLISAIDINNSKDLIVVSGNSGKFMWLLQQ